MKNCKTAAGFTQALHRRLVATIFTMVLILGAVNAFAVEITTESLPFGEKDAYYYVLPNATGGTAPYTWSITAGILPDGLLFDTNTGRIWWYPSVLGDFDLTLQVQDALGASASKTFHLTIYEQLSIPNLTETYSYHVLQVGTSHQLQLIPAGGLPPYNWALTSGTLPTGLSFDAASGTITGTSSTREYSQIVIQLTDAKGSVLSKVLTYQICDPLRIETQYTATLPNGLTGTVYGPNSTNYLTATGGTTSYPYTWSISAGRLPNGLSLNVSGIYAVISGIPTESGSFNFTVKASDGYYATERNFTIFINYVPPTFGYQTDFLRFLIAGQANPIASNVSGGIPPYNFSVTEGSLPAGMTMDPGTGTLNGTPSTSGIGSFTAHLEDNEATTSSSSFPTVTFAGNTDEVWRKTYNPTRYDGARDLALDASGNVYVTGQLTTIKYSPQGTQLSRWDHIKGDYIALDAVGYIYTISAAANDFSVNKYTPSGVLVWSKLNASSYQDIPKGLGIDSYGNIYAVASRTDSYGYDASITKYDFNGNIVWQQFHDTVNQRDEINSAHVDKAGNVLVLGWNGSQYVVKYDSFGNKLWQKLTNYENAWYSAATDQSLNIYLSANNGVSKLDPTGNLIWKSDFTFGNSIWYSKTAVDASGNVYFSAIARLGSGYMGNAMITAAFDKNGNRLGMRSYYDGDYLNDNYWGGRVAADGKGHMYILASSRALSSSFVIKYRLKPFVAPPILPAGRLGASYNQTAQVFSGLPPYTWALATGALPPGLALNSTTGAIIGTPSTLGNYSFSIRVTDANGASTTTALQLLVTDTVCIDADRDGYNADGGSCGPVDCNDSAAAINPGALEIFYNLVDENCNGMLDNEDPDGDGYADGTDCHIYHPGIHPDAAEIPYNGLDENCNGMADDNDLDLDGYKIIDECNDNDPTIHPGATEIPYNGIDENCNGMADDDDRDHDGYNKAVDCNDQIATINPAAVEIPYNGIDENCSGMSDDDDLDNDGFLRAQDCDDALPNIYPGAIEIPYNGIDENCNGMTDDTDFDGDGYDYSVDCKDQIAAINPGATEIPYNSVDENCSGMADDDDLDLDGFGVATDFNDRDPSIYPGAPEIKHDGIDQDCNYYDLTIDISAADYDATNSLLTVKATSALGASANLEVIGYGPMTYKSKQNVWLFNFTGPNPGSVIVSGPEGTETLVVTVQ